VTVGELISELQKFAPHHTVLIEHPTDELGHDFRIAKSTDLASIARVSQGVQGASNMVVLDATGGIV
jgi:hypothetical protein